MNKVRVSINSVKFQTLICRTRLFNFYNLRLYFAKEKNIYFFTKEKQIEDNKLNVNTLNDKI